MKRGRPGRRALERMEDDLAAEDRHEDSEARRLHTTPEEGHPAGRGERSERDIGGPTDPAEAPDEDAPGGAPGTPPDSGFESH